VKGSKKFGSLLFDSSLLLFCGTGNDSIYDSNIGILSNKIFLAATKLNK
jgi:hypothetical protein